MGIETLFETLNVTGDMGNAMALCIKAIGLCGCALIANLAIRVLFTR